MNPSSSFCPHRSAIPAENDGGKFLANERLLRNCVETTDARSVETKTSRWKQTVLSFTLLTHCDKTAL